MRAERGWPFVELDDHYLLDLDDATCPSWREWKQGDGGSGLSRHRASCTGRATAP